jgi:hypothetical protein
MRQKSSVLHNTGLVMTLATVNGKLWLWLWLWWPRGLVRWMLRLHKLVAGARAGLAAPAKGAESDKIDSAPVQVGRRYLPRLERLASAPANGLLRPLGVLTAALR